MKANAVHYKVTMRQSIANQYEGVGLPVAIYQRRIQISLEVMEVHRGHMSGEIDCFPDVV